MASDFFQGIMRWNVERNGVIRPLPYFYYDNFSIAGVYTASKARVKTLIPHPDLHLLEFRPGRCLVAFAAFEYRQTDFEPYNEVNISFLASYKSKPVPLFTLLKTLNSNVFPSYVWQLPVNTEHARAGGVDLFGYPKFLAEIDFSKTTDRVECRLSVSGMDILQLSGRVLPTKRSTPMRYLTYAVEGDNLVSANVLINPIEFAESRRKDDLFLEIGKDHPICQVLNNIQLSKHPMIYQFSSHAESILFPARSVRDE
jgi:hypothetical protein